MPLSTSAKGRGTIIRALRELAHQQWADYPQVTILAHKVEELQQRDDFATCGQAGEWHGRAVILCTGVLDHYPHFEGWEEYVGRTMFWCSTCDGYACKCLRLVAVGNTNAAATEALQLRQTGDHADRLPRQSGWPATSACR